MNLVKLDLQLVKFMEQEHEVIEIAVVSSLYDAQMQGFRSRSRFPKSPPPPPPPPPPPLLVSRALQKGCSGCVRRGRRAARARPGGFGWLLYIGMRDRKSARRYSTSMRLVRRSYSDEATVGNTETVSSESQQSDRPLGQTVVRRYSVRVLVRLLRVPNTSTVPHLCYSTSTVPVLVRVPYLSCFIMPSPTLYPNNRQSPLGY